jgi:hypothetical protein
LCGGCSRSAAFTPLQHRQALPHRSGLKSALLPKAEITNKDVYAFERKLESLHPDNSDSHRERAATSRITP